MKDKNIDIQGSMVTLTLSKENISECGNIIKNVSILSKNSIDTKGKIVRVFSDKALNDAVTIFNGALARIDHDRKAVESRGVSTAFGAYSNIRRTGDTIIGDLTLWDCVEAKKVKSIAERTPTVVGNSIHAGGLGAMGKDGIEVIESILPRTRNGFKSSVDLVDDPAATVNLFEDKINDNGKENNMEFKDLTLEALKVNRPDLVKSAVEDSKEFKDLAQDKTNLQKKVDEYQLKEVLASRSATIAKVIGEVKLPELAVTETFKQQLNDITESKPEDFEKKVRELCADRMKVVSTGGVHGNFEKGKGGDGKTSTDGLRDILLSK